MSVLDSDSNTLAIIIEDPGFDEAQVAAAAFLARYNGRTLDAYRFDLRTFFQLTFRTCGHPFTSPTPQHARPV